MLVWGTSFDYVGADGFYGNDCNLTRKVDLLGLTYMFDIHSNQPIYLEKPELVLPERKGNRGRIPKRLKANAEHSIKEATYILGMVQFQTRKWLAWYHQVAMNIMTMGFMLKEKLLNFKDLPLLSARDIKDWLSFLMAKEFTEEDMIQLIFNRHRRRQSAINSCYLKEYANVSK